MKYLKLDERGNIILDEDGLPISCNYISRARKFSVVMKCIRFFEGQNFHLRGIVPGVILILTRIEVSKFTWDSLPRALLFTWAVGACLTGFMLAYLGCWNISTRQFDAIQDKVKRIEYFSNIENIKKRRGEGFFWFYYLLPGCYVFYWLLAYNYQG